MLVEAAAKKLLGRALAAAKKLGAGQRELTSVASLRSSRGGHTRFGASEVTQATEVERLELTVTIGLGKRRASATTNQTGGGSVDDVVARALRLARLSPENPEAMPPLGAQRYARAPGAVDAATARAGAAVRAAAAKIAIDRARAAGLKIAGFYEVEHTSTSLASSAGLWAHHEATAAKYSCSARTPEGSGAGSAGAASFRVADLDAEEVATVAIGKALAAARPRKLEPGKLTVILEPAAAGALASFVLDALDARTADEGRSFYSKQGGGTRVGERLFPETISIRSDPGDYAAGGQPFDGEGVPQRQTAWIDRGVLTALPYDRYWAQQQGKPATGYASGWSIAGGAASRDELIKGVTRGLLITRFFYLGLVDPQLLRVTGLTRDGVFLIERGAIVGPVNNFRFNHSAADLLARCDGLGAAEVVNVDGGGRVRAPLLRSQDFQLTSISEAI
jgi:predicted Zn-dependent protease